MVHKCDAAIGFISLSLAPAKSVENENTLKQMFKREKKKLLKAIKMEHWALSYQGVYVYLHIVKYLS